jgi:hypothetical protein
MFIITKLKVGNMVEIFSTNVRRASQAKEIIALLTKHFPGIKINFDLSDCDRVLKIAGKNLVPEKVMIMVRQKGFECRPLE